MEKSLIREIIQKDLPALVMEDPQIRDWVWHLVHNYAPSRHETESRFEQMLTELRLMREDSERKWEENQRKWEENQRKWEENQRQLQAMREDSERKWEENQRKWEENQRKWEENQRKWEENQRQLQAMREESERKWEENQREIRAMMEKLTRVDRLERTIGAMGARWGLSSEASFRNALAGILEESFGVKVEHVEEHDREGEVFGHPSSIELDVIIHNGQVIVCEIKSSTSRADVFAFERKVRWYEKYGRRKVNRMILISPMVYEKDRKQAQELGIEVYSDVEDVQM